MAVAAYLTWWLSSPGAAWFLFLNVLVGAIAVTSSRAQQRRCRAASPVRRLCRSASSMVLDRLRSFSIHPTGDGEWCWYRSPEADKIQAEEEWVPEPAAVVAEHAGTAPAKALAATAAADAAEAVASDGPRAVGRQSDEQRGSPTTPPEQRRQVAEPAVVGVPTATEATWTSAVPPGPQQEEAAATVAESAKPKRRARAYAAEVEGKAELNARAERFIQQFRQDLRLQRLNSMLGHAHTLSN